MNFSVLEKKKLLEKFKHEVSVGPLSSKESSTFIDRVHEASETLYKFAPLFAQKTIKNKFDELSTPKHGKINIPKEALTKPHTGASDREGLVEYLKKRQKRAEKNKEAYKNLNEQLKHKRHSMSVSFVIQSFLSEATFVG